MIRARVRRRGKGLVAWIPAYAGMTRWRGGGLASVIPANAGIHEWEGVGVRGGPDAG